VSLRRLLPLVILLALVFAPFGRIAAAEAMAVSHHQPMATAGRCADMPMPADDTADKRAVDCMIACAVIAQLGSPALAATSTVAVPPAPVVHATFRGLHPEAEPPPPRFS
jgi:hypothetical protein